MSKAAETETVQTAPNTDVTETVPTSLDFDVVERPVPVPRRENLFAKPVGELAAEWDEADGRSKKARSVVVPTTFLSRAKKDIGAAAKALDPKRTARIEVTENAGGDASKSRITFYLREYIAKPRATAESTAASS